MPHSNDVWISPSQDVILDGIRYSVRAKPSTDSFAGWWECRLCKVSEASIACLTSNEALRIATQVVKNHHLAHHSH